MREPPEKAESVGLGIDAEGKDEWREMLVWSPLGE